MRTQVRNFWHLSESSDVPTGWRSQHCFCFCDYDSVILDLYGIFTFPSFTVKSLYSAHISPTWEVQLLIQLKRISSAFLYRLSELERWWKRKIHRNTSVMGFQLLHSLCFHELVAWCLFHIEAFLMLYLSLGIPYLLYIWLFFIYQSVISVYLMY